jgi:hypothetical protein
MIARDVVMRFLLLLKINLLLNLKICKKETNARYCIDTLENWCECLPLFKGEERKVYNSMTQAGDSVAEVSGTDGRGF